MESNTKGEAKPKQCSVCKDPNKESYLLFCMHTICKDCAQKQLTGKPSPYFLQCGFCKNQTKTDLEIDKSLPKDIRFWHSSDEIQQQKNTLLVKPKCAQCVPEKSPNLAICACRGPLCGRILLCEKCKPLHKKQKGTHLFEEDIESNIDEGQLKKCESHEEELCYICLQCNIPVCNACLQATHKDHFRIHTKEVGVKFGNSLKKYIELISEDLKICDSDLNTYNSLKKTVQEESKLSFVELEKKEVQLKYMITYLFTILKTKLQEKVLKSSQIIETNENQIITRQNSLLAFQELINNSFAISNFQQIHLLSEFSAETYQFLHTETHCFFPVLNFPLFTSFNDQLEKEIIEYGHITEFFNEKEIPIQALYLKDSEKQSQLISGPDEKELIIKYGFCAIHKSEMKLYCIEDECTICADCKSLGPTHDKHNTITIEKAWEEKYLVNYEKFAKSINEILKSLDEKQANFNKKLVNDKGMFESILKNSDSILHSSIIQAFQTFSDIKNMNAQVLQKEYWSLRKIVQFKISEMRVLEKLKNIKPYFIVKVKELNNEFQIIQKQHNDVCMLFESYFKDIERFYAELDKNIKKSDPERIQIKDISALLKSNFEALSNKNSNFYKQNEKKIENNVLNDEYGGSLSLEELLQMKLEKTDIPIGNNSVNGTSASTIDPKRKVIWSLHGVKDNKGRNLYKIKINEKTVKAIELPLNTFGSYPIFDGNSFIYITECNNDGDSKGFIRINTETEKIENLPPAPTGYFYCMSGAFQNKKIYKLNYNYYLMAFDVIENKWTDNIYNFNYYGHFINHPTNSDILYFMNDKGEISEYSIPTNSIITTFWNGNYSLTSGGNNIAFISLPEKNYPDHALLIFSDPPARVYSTRTDLWTKFTQNIAQHFSGYGGHILFDGKQIWTQQVDPNFWYALK